MERTRRVELLSLTALLALGPAACGQDPGDERLEAQGAPPAAALFSARQGSESLDRQLELLLAEMEAGMAGDPDRLLRAEAITDGLMEARRPFDWLGTGYDVEARLRQLQAMADRVVARLRRGASLSEVEEDVAIISRAVTDLRHQMATSRGGPAPPSLDSLLQEDPMANARAGRRAELPPPPGTETPETANEPDPPPPPAPTGPRPLGRPLPDTSGTGR